MNITTDINEIDNIQLMRNHLDKTCRGYIQSLYTIEEIKIQNIDDLRDFLKLQIKVKLKRYAEYRQVVDDENTERLKYYKEINDYFWSYLRTEAKGYELVPILKFADCIEINESACVYNYLSEPVSDKPNTIEEMKMLQNCKTSD